MDDPVDRVMENLRREVEDAQAKMLRVLSRQNRWRKQDLHDAIGGFRYCNSSVASLAAMRLIDADVAYLDEQFFIRKKPAELTHESSLDGLEPSGGKEARV